ncbi:hypothetical protein BDQ12DRAFT_693693 [Crucibulum laeve]|uniref:Uncharacterized protein n=1 Tax=Crucibulum laeve TaxID=68775 RepID=A0A5C3LFW6_9AGAR|nr:hypothetical protein BDQ12DRAFT_693693 [Crucibulum laeve]
MRKLRGPLISLFMTVPAHVPCICGCGSSNMRYRFASATISYCFVFILHLLTSLPLVFSVFCFQKPIHTRCPNRKYSSTSPHPSPSDLMEEYVFCLCAYTHDDGLAQRHEIDICVVS